MAHYTPQDRTGNPGALLTTEHAAQYLGISPRTLNNWRWMGGGKGPAFVRVGRAVRYSVQTLDAWVAGRTFDSTSTACDTDRNER